MGKGQQGIWGSALVFDKKLYLTRDLVFADFVPTDLKLPKPAPEPEPPNNLLPMSPVAKRRRPVSVCKCSGCVIAGRRMVSVANCFERGPCNAFALFALFPFYAYGCATVCQLKFRHTLPTKYPPLPKKNSKKTAVVDYVAP